LYISQRQLERQFKEHIGLSPKMMLRIERFRCALQMVQKSTGRGTLTDVAHTCGYADQAHFIRECRELAGDTPSYLFNRTETLVAPVLL
jgi:transcriptional regulator GlxA family with amidase domain